MQLLVSWKGLLTEVTNTERYDADVPNGGRKVFESIEEWNNFAPRVASALNKARDSWSKKNHTCVHRTMTVVVGGKKVIKVVRVWCPEDPMKVWVYDATNFTLI